MGYFKHVVQDIHFDNHGTIIKCSFPCSRVLRDCRKSWGQLIRFSETKLIKISGKAVIEYMMLDLNFLKGGGEITDIVLT